MASQGPNSPSSAASSGSGVAWSSPANAEASDNAYATASLNGNNSQELQASGFGFAVSGTIDGIVVEIERKSGSGFISDLTIKVMKGGSTSGVTNHSTGASWPTSDAYATYGTSSDLWGQTWTASDINASNFGVSLSASNAGAPDTASVDHVRVTVYYTPVSYSLAIGSGSYSLSGTAATLEYGRDVTAGAGSYSQTGSSVSLVHGRPLTASAGSYTLSGSDVALLAPLSLTASPGAYSVTGSTVALKWGHRVVVASGSYTLTGSPAFPVSVTTEDSGACGIQGSFTSECSGVFRLANDIDGYNLYVGEDALPDFDAAPAAFSATLPVSLVITPPAMGTKTLYAAVRKQDKYGLESRNQRTTRFHINTSGDLVRLPLSSVVGLQVAERQGGYVRVLATYPAFADEDDPPSHWKVWAGNTEPDIGVDAPAIQSTMSSVFAGQVGPFSPGIVYVKVVAWRNVDAVSSPTASASLTLSDTPDRPVAVRGGYDEP